MIHYSTLQKHVSMLETFKAPSAQTHICWSGRTGATKYFFIVARSSFQSQMRLIWSHCRALLLIWIFRGSVVCMITSSHFDIIDSSEETNAFCSSEPNRNDCWRLVPPPWLDWFKLSHIQPINIGFGLLNHHLTYCKVKVKSVVRAWKQTQNNTFAWENSLKKHRKIHDWVV